MKKNPHAAAMGRLRAKKLTAARRQEIARMGAEARWSKYRQAKLSAQDATSLDATVGQALRALRIARGQTQIPVARAAGISPGNLSLIENGIVPAHDKTVSKILEALGATRDLLRDLSEVLRQAKLSAQDATS